MFDENGYPTEDILSTIKNWRNTNTMDDLIDLVKKAWRYPNYVDEYDGVDNLNRPIRILELSTGGWSGNESIIKALQENTIFWMLYWYSSRCGGHYVFHIRNS